MINYILFLCAVEKLKRTEYDEESTVSFYFDGLEPKGDDICWRMRASQTFQVRQNNHEGGR